MVSIPGGANGWIGLLVRSGQEKVGWAFARFCLGQEWGQESGSL